MKYTFSSSTRGGLAILDTKGKLVYNKFNYFDYAQGILVIDANIYLNGSEKNVYNFVKNRIVKLDKAGNVLKETSFDEFCNKENISNYNSSMVQTSDGNLALLGYWVTKDVESIQNVGICKFDRDLNIIWYKYYNNTSNADLKFHIWPYMTATPDNGLVYTNEINLLDSIFWTEPPKYTGYGKSAVVFNKVDSIGELVWTDTLLNLLNPGHNAYPFREIYKLMTSKNGDIVGVGLYYQKIDEIKEKAYICRYSPDGVLKWEHRYFDPHYGGDCYFRTMKEDLDGNLICVGEIEDIDGEWNNSSLSWVLKLDSMGCFEPGCRTDTLTEVVITKTDETIINLTGKIVIYPNPAIDHISIIFPEGYNPASCQIYNMMGQLVKSGIQDFDEINISGLSSGIYIIKSKDEKGRIAVGKFQIIEN